MTNARARSGACAAALSNFLWGLPAEGFEPPTYGLQNRCTTSVLSRRGEGCIIADEFV
jgi:hypothetical protein